MADQPTPERPEAARPPRPAPRQQQAPPPRGPPPPVHPPGYSAEAALAAKRPAGAYVVPQEEASVLGALEGVQFPTTRAALVEAVRGRRIEYRPGQHLMVEDLLALTQAPRFHDAGEVVELARHAAGDALKIAKMRGG